MAEIIQLFEFQVARQRAQRRLSRQRSLVHAVAILRENLVTAAQLLMDAPAIEQPNLLDAVERLTAMIRYGMRMIAEPGAADNPAAETSSH
jgi:hypothetical protein